MAAAGFPVLLKYLQNERNVAADRACVEALPYADADLQRALVELLLQRAHQPSLVELVGRYSTFAEAVKELLVHRAGDLFSAAGTAVRSPDLDQRRGAVEFVSRARCGPLYHHLGEALRSGCARTRESAAAGLRAAAADLLEAFDAGPAEVPPRRPHACADQLVEVLVRAVMSWEVHRQAEALEAALWFSDRLVEPLCRKLRQRRSRLALAINNMLNHASDPRIAGFTMRALTIPELRPAAARAISQATSIGFIRALLGQSYLLADPQVERGFRLVNGIRFFRDNLDDLLRMDPIYMAAAVRISGAAGGKREHRNEIFTALIDVGSEEVRAAVLRELIRDRSDAALDVLMIAAGRGYGRLSELALRELESRRPDDAPPPRTETTADAAHPRTAARLAFARYWDEFDGCEPVERRRLTATIREIAEDIIALLRKKLSSSWAPDRSRALRIAGALGVIKELSAQVYVLARDRHSLVRGIAVGMLAELPGMTARRILCEAASDPDGRVRANAIEALETLGASERAAVTLPGLESTDARVRSNSVKSLFKLGLPQATQTLSSMLEGPSRSHRLSALWAADKLAVDPPQERREEITPRERGSRFGGGAQRLDPNRDATAGKLRSVHETLRVETNEPQSAQFLAGPVP